MIGKKKNSSGKKLEICEERVQLKRIIRRNKNSSGKKPEICVSSPKSASRSGPVACERYERFWQLGYGPPGGNEIDEDGWVNYFKTLSPYENKKMLDHMYRDLYNLRDPEEEWDGWIEQVDTNLTSRSEVFKDHPDCQLMWQKRYAPPDAVNWDLKAWQDHVDAMSLAAYTTMERALFYRPINDGNHNDNRLKTRQDQKELWEKYWEQSSESEGFDVEVYPTNGGGVIQPMFNGTRSLYAGTYDMLSNCASLAVDVYNQKEGTDYTVNRVLKACSQLVAGKMYFITFEVKKSEERFQVFQAEVYAPPVNKAKKVVLVRPKAMVRMPNEMKDLFTPPRDPNHAAKLWETYLNQIKKSEGFDIDVCSTEGSGIIKPMFNNTSPVTAEIYYMLSNCSRIALDAYNQLEGTDYTVNRVVKVCTQVDCVTMYFISFEVKKSEDRFQVFHAKVYDDPITGENKVLLVRPKAMVKDLVMTARDYHRDAKHLEKYVKQIEETEGFDIDLRISDGDGTIVPMFTDMSCAKTDNSLINYSRNAIYAYNDREGSDYSLYQVLKACAQTVAGGMYYITFEAINSDKRLHVFQAMVFETTKGQIEVLLVRLKA